MDTSSIRDGRSRFDVTATRHRLRRLLDWLSGRATSVLAVSLGDRLLSREDLGKVAAAEGVVYEYGEPESFVLDPPESPASPKGMVGKRVGRHTLSQPFVAELSDCTLLGAYPIAFTSRGEIVLEAVVREGVLARNLVGSLVHLVSNPTSVRTFRAGDDGETIDTACLLFNYWASGYFHWVYESVIRIEGVERYCEETGRSPTLILGPDPPSWQCEILELLGYGPDDWLCWDHGRARVNRLVVPTVRREEVLSPGAVRWLRKRVRRRLKTDRTPDPAEFPDRVYVSRDDADRRRVANEEHMFAVLSELGFSRVVLSELSVPEQAALFADAEVIVAPHGAGLTNLTYASDPVVFELFPEGDIRGQYYQLAKILDFEYHYLVSKTVGGDLQVDIEELRERLAAVDRLEA